jgi:hypothetical protein
MMAIPESFWSGAGALMSAISIGFMAWLNARHAALVAQVKEVATKVEKVEENTNGINSKLQDKIALQDQERVHTAEMTEKDKAIALAKRSDSD